MLITHIQPAPHFLVTVPQPQNQIQAQDAKAPFQLKTSPSFFRLQSLRQGKLMDCHQHAVMVNALNTDSEPSTALQ